MPVLDGLEASRRLLAREDAPKVLVLTTFDEEEYLYEALRAGTSGFLLKVSPPEQLIGAVRTVAAGNALIDPAVTRRVIAAFGRRAARADRRRRDGQDPRRPRADEARAARPRPGRRLRLRARDRRAGRRLECLTRRKPSDANLHNSALANS
jgi:DNA-binding NarL/FixJ family response regulator